MQAKARPSSIGGAIAASAAMLLCLTALPPTAAAITPTGEFSGTVKSSEGKAIEKAEVCWYDASNDEKVKCKPEATNAEGKYTIKEVPEGNYKVEFNAPGYARQYYRESTNIFEAEPIIVTESHLTENINAALLEVGEGKIAGRVTSSAGGPLGGVEVCATGGSGEEFSNVCSETNANGEYTVERLKVGTYFMFFASASACEEELGEKVRCNEKANVISASVAHLTVHNAKTETVNEVLAIGGEISGTVTSASITHPPIAHIAVCATQVNAEGHANGGGGCGYTNTAGQYTIMGLPTGSYKVEYDGYVCHVIKKGESECPELYVGQFYTGKATFSQATAVAVTQGALTANINESLRPAFPAAPTASAPPTLAGTGAVGQTLTCSQGTWANEPLFLTYQWERSGVAIAGASGATYTIQAADEGSSITCVVTAGNGAGIASAASAAVAVPKPIAEVVGASVKGTTVLLQVRCSGAPECAGKIKLTVRVRHGKHVKTVVLGSGAFSVAAGKTAVVHLKLGALGGKALRKAGKRGLTINLSGTGIKGRSLHLKGAKGAKRHGKKR
ncbi:MAG TPA: carboxypeptidase regulatory-like domain-containing protein [Solirubrobacteraceae bacterium]|nr:carboxypeptidase regulatory-like domain-containing protein [Solirubrobacteraceae bacterium]